MKRSAWLVPAFILVLATGYFFGRAGQESPGGHEAGIARTWTCSMHPQIQQPEAGSCPLCGMDLIEARAGGAVAEESIQLSARDQRLAAVETTVVERRAAARSLRLFGTLMVPESAERTVTARVAGRIERVHVDEDGIEVREGVGLVDFYSPDLYAAQQEFLASRARGSAMADASRERLLAWGLSIDQLDRLAREGTARDVVTLQAPVGGVVLARDVVEGRWVEVGAVLYEIAPLDPLWLQLEVYESQLAGVREGLPVHFTLQAFPGRELAGEVGFIGRVIDPVKHSVLARVVVSNHDQQLRPGMFARARIEVPVDGLPVVIPVTAPLITGERAVVFVEDPEHPGEYRMRGVTLGPRAGDHYVVTSGLEEGERVVSRGAFRLDSSLQIEGKRGMMDPGGER